MIQDRPWPNHATPENLRIGPRSCWLLPFDACPHCGGKMASDGRTAWCATHGAACSPPTPRHPDLDQHEGYVETP